ncbi:unnamed protein product, partial [Urochloa humidicola]
TGGPFHPQRRPSPPRSPPSLLLSLFTAAALLPFASAPSQLASLPALEMMGRLQLVRLRGMAAWHPGWMAALLAWIGWSPSGSPAVGAVSIGRRHIHHHRHPLGPRDQRFMSLQLIRNSSGVQDRIEWVKLNVILLISIFKLVRFYHWPNLQ